MARVTAGLSVDENPMAYLFVFFLGIGLFGWFVGSILELDTVGLFICMSANCLLFVLASVVGIVAFCNSLKASQFYYIEDNEPKVKLDLKAGAFSYTVNIPIKETTCPNCKEEISCQVSTPSPSSD